MSVLTQVFQTSQAGEISHLLMPSASSINPFSWKQEVQAFSRLPHQVFLSCLGTCVFCLFGSVCYHALRWGDSVTLPPVLPLLRTLPPSSSQQREARG